MANPIVILCNAPCLTESLDPERLHDALQGSVDIHSIPYVCSQNGIRKIEGLLKGEKGVRALILTGECPVAKEFLNSIPFLMKQQVEILDVSSFATETIAAAHILFHLKKPKKPVAHKSKRVYDDAVLVIGGGVAGVQAALDLAEAGKTVYLVERAVSIGGIMSQLDKTFPTLDCSICILGPKLADVGRNTNIELLTFTEVKSIKGSAGHFDVTLTLHPRYVDMDRCTGCGACAEVCPVILPNEWDLNLKPRKCIHILFAQSIPLRSTIDMEHCIKCQLCVQACEKDAINLEDQGGEKRIKVGAIIVAPRP